jgi:hypothetical protein
MKQERQASSYTASCVFHDASVLKLFWDGKNVSFVLYRF